MMMGKKSLPVCTDVFDWEFYRGIDSSFHMANGYGDIQVQIILD